MHAETCQMLNEWDGYLFAHAIYYISVTGHCSKLHYHLLCHENASTGFMVKFRLLVVGRYSVYAVGN